MNWFQRYGIPGAFFYGLIFVLLYLYYPCKINQFKEIIEKIIVPFTLLTFLPVGYLISILQQILYYKCLGIHKKAIIESNFDIYKYYNELNFKKNELIIEALSVLYTTGINVNKIIKIDELKFRQEWISRRMDILSINLSLILSTFFSIIFILIPILCFKWQFQINIIKMIFSSLIAIIILLILSISYCIIKNQLIKFISEIYKTYKKNEKKKQKR